MAEKLNVISDYWDARSNGFSEAVDDELHGETGARFRALFRRELPEDAEVLDLGAGPGFFSFILCELGCRVTAVDASTEMLAKLHERLVRGGYRAELRHMDVQSLAFEDGTFDAVVTRNVIWNLEHPFRCYQEIARILKPGGLLIQEDGNHYLWHHDDAYRQKHEEFLCTMKEKADHSCHARYNSDGVDFQIMDRIADDLPLSRKRRPQWDVDALLGCGFDELHIKTDGDPLPGSFEILARKAVAGTEHIYSQKEKRSLP